MEERRLSLSTWVVLLLIQFLAVCAEDIQQQQNIDLLYQQPEFDATELARGKQKKKKMKYMLPFLLAVAVAKSLLIPLVFKALALVSGKALMLSLLSLFVSSFVGLKKIAYSGWDRMAHWPLRDRGDSVTTAPPPPTDGLYHKFTDQHWSRRLDNSANSLNYPSQYNT